jgi:hypothetical protein
MNHGTNPRRPISAGSPHEKDRMTCPRSPRTMKGAIVGLDLFDGVGR